MMGRADDARRRSAETKRQRTRAALLDAARRFLEDRRPWPSVKMDEVATAAGVSLATAYNHFPSKDALTHELIRYSPFGLSLEDVDQLIREGGREPRRVLKNALIRISAMLWDHAATLQLVATSLDSQHSIDYMKHATGVLAKVISFAQQAGVIDQDFSAEELAEYHVTAMVSYVVSVGGRQSFRKACGLMMWQTYLALSASSLARPRTALARPLLSASWLAEVDQRWVKDAEYTE